MVGKPDKLLPVVKVKKEAGSGSVKILNRNMLLPFSSIPTTSDVGDSLLSNKEDKHQKKEVRTKGNPVVPSVSEISESESDSEYSIPMYVIPQKRNVKPNASVSGTTENVKSRCLRDTISSISTEPTMPSLNNNFVGSTATDIPSITIASVSLSPSSVQVPRRTGRARKPPDRYGEWISNQVTAVPSECQICLIYCWYFSISVYFNCVSVFYLLICRGECHKISYL